MELFTEGGGMTTEKRGEEPIPFREGLMQT
jgi:hypothetical protein